MRLSGPRSHGQKHESVADAADEHALRRKVIQSLEDQGFRVREGRLTPPGLENKESIRQLHREAVRHVVERSRPGLERHEDSLLTSIAAGHEIDPDKMWPRLVEVKPNSRDELLFRYARLHWSIPVSAGYGRRIRFVVYDESNGKLMGIFGLGDPVFRLAPRDEWIGWSSKEQAEHLRSVMDLFVLGAVPPYSLLLCGKLIALLATSGPVQKAFRRKYGGRTSLITGRPLSGGLALLTTTSALGRSALYNRLRYGQERVYRSVGFTSGSGEFHFLNGIYSDLRRFALEHCDPTAKQADWGTGFRSRRELVRKVLPLLGLPREFVYHGVRREIFVAPLAANTQAFLCGKHQRLRQHRRTVDDLFLWFRERWLLPRAVCDKRYRSFDPKSYRLWRTN